MADLFDRFGNKISVATTSELQSTGIENLVNVSVNNPLQGQYLVYNENLGVWGNLDVHDGIDLHDQTKAYSANEVVVKDNIIYAANDVIPADTAFSEGESGATWRVIGSTGGVVQPTVETIDGASGTVSLDVDDFNWFNVTPSGDVELEFNLTTQNEGRFDLVWENASSGTVTSGYAFGSATLGSQLDVSNEIDGTLYGVNVGGPNSEFIYAVGSDSSGNAKIAQYLMATPGDLSTATFLRDDVSPTFIGYFTVEFNSNGTKMFVTDTDSSFPGIHEWNLGTPWNLSSLAFQDSWGLAVEGGLTRSSSLLFAPDGLTIFVSDFSNPGIVYELDSGQPFDFGNITYSSVSYDLGVGSSRLSGLEFNSDGTKLFALADGTVHRFTLLTPYDLSTATNDNVTLSVDTSDFRFTADGINLYSADLASKTISQYSTSEQAPGPLAQLTFADTIDWSSGSEPALSTTDGAKDWFKFETKDGGTTWYGELYAGEAATVPATQAYVDDKITNWTSLSTRWDTEPALVSTIAEGDVYTYTLDGTTRYRLVPDPYSAENDAFYATFSGGVLSDLITKRNNPL